MMTAQIPETTPRESYYRGRLLLGSFPLPMPTSTPVAEQHWSEFWRLLTKVGYSGPEQSLRGAILWERMLDRVTSGISSVGVWDDRATLDALWATWRRESEALVAALGGANITTSSVLLLAELHGLLALHASEPEGDASFTLSWMDRADKWTGQAEFSDLTDRGMFLGVLAQTTAATATFGPGGGFHDPRNITSVAPQVYFQEPAPGRALEIHLSSTAGGWTNYSRVVIDTSEPYRGRPKSIPTSAFTAVGTGADFTQIRDIRIKVTGGTAAVFLGPVSGQGPS